MHEQSPSAARPGSACIVVADAAELDRRSAELRSAGGDPRSYHFLCCASDGPGSGDRAGFTVSWLAKLAVPDVFRVANLYRPARPDHSDAVRLVLDRLHHTHQFARVEFPARGGLGFRTVQAKRAGLGFEDVTLVVRLDRSAAYDRERAERWPAGYDEVEAEFMERFAFEHADERATPDPSLVAFARRKGWVARPATVARTDAPTVTVGLAHHNLGRYLPATLASLAAQTYPNLDVIVIDDGSTELDSIRVFGEQEARYPGWRFLRQPNAGIGTTRNRCVGLARGDFFLPVDADNLFRTDMVERFVGGLVRNPDLAAMTCYHLAFAGDGDHPDRYLFACRPTGGPHALAAVRNVYGDANAIFRTDALRAAGGYETDRGTSNEDWELFVKLVHAGGRVGVIPDHLFLYRHRATGFSRATNWFANHQRVLRQFASSQAFPPGEAEVLWTALLGSYQELARLKAGPACRRHRVADAVYHAVRSVPRAVGRLVRRRAGVRSPRPSS